MSGPHLRQWENMLVKLVMGTIAILMLSTVQAAQAPVVVAIPVKQEVKEVEELTVDQMVYKYAEQYNVSPTLMFKIMNCENTGRIPTLQSGLRYTVDHPEWGVKAGDRELSYGLVQIHLPSHPTVTYEQATDPEFSVEFLAKGLVSGVRWSCNK